MTLLTYIIMELTPGSPFDLENANGITPEMIAKLEHDYGLDKPWYERYGIYVKNAVTGNFGQSYSYRPQQVSDIIKRTLPYSLKLGLYATLFAIFLGMPLGIIAAVNQNGIVDYISVTVSILFYSMPNFVMGFVLILIFVVYLPQNGIDLGLRPAGIQSARDWILPTIALGAAPLATISRYTRSSMIDVIRSDYVRTARAKGLAQRKVILKHVLKNALIPVVTLIGPIFAIVGTGSFFVEKIFNVPGMGKFYIESMQSKDQTMILAVVLIFGVFLAIMNIIVDIVYGLIDPRIRY
ncbi:MAG TPA: ABC transporter permease [Thermomicrobiales bacterium]|nr:ABC transporter permease [Thermomicrobiales bacterium]